MEHRQGKATLTVDLRELGSCICFMLMSSDIDRTLATVGLDAADAWIGGPLPPLINSGKTGWRGRGPRNRSTWLSIWKWRCRWGCGCSELMRPSSPLTGFRTNALYVSTMRPTESFIGRTGRMLPAANHTGAGPCCSGKSARDNYEG